MMDSNRSLPQMAGIYLGAILILVWSGGPFLWQFSTSFQLDKALDLMFKENPARLLGLNRTVGQR